MAILRIESQTRWQATFPVIVNDKNALILVWIPVGEFEMGDGKGEDCSSHQVYLDGYYLGVNCITNRQYKKFVDETGHRPPDNTVWGALRQRENFSEKFADHPVVSVSLEDAVYYCNWVACSCLPRHSGIDERGDLACSSIPGGTSLIGGGADIPGTRETGPPAL